MVRHLLSGGKGRLCGISTTCSTGGTDWIVTIIVMQGEIFVAGTVMATPTVLEPVTSTIEPHSLNALLNRAPIISRKIARWRIPPIGKADSCQQGSVVVEIACSPAAQKSAAKCKF
jgi:hypothetical protein